MLKIKTIFNVFFFNTYTFPTALLKVESRCFSTCSSVALQLLYNVFLFPQVFHGILYPKRCIQNFYKRIEHFKSVAYHKQCEIHIKQHVGFFFLLLTPRILETKTISSNIHITVSFWNRASSILSGEFKNTLYEW